MRRDYEKALKGNEDAYINEGNEEALMGDKKRYRATEDVIRWQERHWGAMEMRLKETRTCLRSF